jgi:hypothetical protein
MLLPPAGRTLALSTGCTVKATAAIAWERYDASALLWAALVGELVAAVLLLASRNVPPVLLRSLQLFLRF